MDGRAKDTGVCQDMLKRLEETKQIYIVGLDVPISVTKGLFSLLDEKRREVARQKGIPEEQFDLEDLLGYFLGVVDPAGGKTPVSKCWSCGFVFEDDRAAFCEACQTFVCPSCGTHYCNLPEPAKRALDAEMWSMRLWEPYSDPPKRKKRSSSGQAAVNERTGNILGRAGHGTGERPQEITMDEIKKLVDEVPDVNNPAEINYWMAKDDISIYLEGWSDACLAGTGFPLMAGGNHENKINYMKELTPGILKRKAEEKGLRLIKGGFMETEGATNLYGVTYGVYRKHSDQTDERTRDILRRAGYGV